MKTFKVEVYVTGQRTGELHYSKHEHIVKAGNLKALVRRLKDMEIINGREDVHIEEIRNPEANK